MNNSEQKAIPHTVAGSFSEKYKIACIAKGLIILGFTKLRKEVLNKMEKGCVLRHFVASKIVDSRFYLIDENGQLNDVNIFVGTHLVKSGLLEFIGTTGNNKDYRLK